MQRGEGDEGAAGKSGEQRRGRGEEGELVLDEGATVPVTLALCAPDENFMIKCKNYNQTCIESIY